MERRYTEEEAESHEEVNASTSVKLCFSLRIPPW